MFFIIMLCKCFSKLLIKFRVYPCILLEFIRNFFVPGAIFNKSTSDFGTALVYQKCASISIVALIYIAECVLSAFFLEQRVTRCGYADVFIISISAIRLFFFCKSEGHFIHIATQMRCKTLCFKVIMLGLMSPLGAIKKCIKHDKNWNEIKLD